jgi:undecaprenyl diphosphate synthase
MIRTLGHRYAMKAVKTAISYCSQIGIKVLTMYAFSTENWKRPVDEVDTLMNLIVEFLLKETPEMKKNNVVLRFIGDLSRLPEKSKRAIEYSVAEMKDNSGLKVNIALNYGGRADIVSATKEICKRVQMGELSVEDINETLFSGYLYTAADPDPDLIIRSGGETRLSNFLTWQSAYSELYFTDVLWPDFGEKEFDDAILYFQGRDRRYGGIK